MKYRYKPLTITCLLLLMILGNGRVSATPITTTVNPTPSNIKLITNTNSQHIDIQTNTRSAAKALAEISYTSISMANDITNANIFSSHLKQFSLPPPSTSPSLGLKLTEQEANTTSERPRPLFGLNRKTNQALLGIKLEETVQKEDHAESHYNFSESAIFAVLLPILLIAMALASSFFTRK